MICKVCGRTTANEEANFCEYCGSSFREMNSQPVVDQMAVEKAAMAENQKTVQSGVEQKPVSVLNWLLILVLPLVPWVGWIAFLVLLVMWGFGKRESQNISRRNFARAMLIFVGIMFVLIMAISYMMATDFINSGLSWSDYMNQMMNTVNNMA